MAGEPLFRQGLILGDSETDPALRALVTTVRSVESASDEAVASEKALATELAAVPVAPVSGTDGAVVLFDGTSGRVLKDSTRVPGAAYGLATLDSGGKLTSGQRVTDAHAASHGSGQSDAVSLNASQISAGVLDIARIPPTAIERLYDVANDAARFALTSAEVQNGDTVRVNDTSPGRLFMVVDDTQLSTEAGYVAYSAGTVPYANVTGKPNLVVGPASAVDGRIALFDGTSGALVKDSGLTSSSFLSSSDLTVTKQGNTFNGNSQLVQTTSEGKLPAIDGSLLTGITTGGSGDSVKFTVTISHSFTNSDVGKPIARVGSSYALAQAGDISTIEVAGVLASQTTGSFVLQQSGKLTWSSHGFTGPVVLVSATVAGGLTETPPTSAGQFLKPIYRVVDADTLEVLDHPATQIAAAGSYSKDFTNTDLGSGLLTVTHSLGQRVLGWTLTDNNGKACIPTDLTFSDANTCVLDVSSFGTITGTWNLFLTKGAGGSAGGGGMWTLVERRTLSAMATTVSFTGLSGDADIKYYVSARIIDRGQNNAIYVRPNGVATANGYTYAENENGSDGGTGQSTGLIIAFTSGSAGSVHHSEGVLWAKTGCYRTSIVNQQRYMSASSCGAFTITSTWRDSTTPITSLDVVAGGTNDIDAGSVIELWKLSDGAPRASASEWTLHERYTVTGSAATTKTFSGLNGDVDRRYKIVFDVKSGATAYGLVWFNSDTTVANYTTARHYYYGNPTAGQGIAQDVASSGIAGFHFTNGYRSTGEVTLQSISGYPRMVRTSNCDDEGTEIDSFESVGKWKTSANTENITSINFGGVTNCLGVGSVIELWKLGQ